MTEPTDEVAELRARLAALEAAGTTNVAQPAPIVSPPLPAAPTRKVSLGLGVGIFLLPIVFVWFLLRSGYSATARVVGFGWFALGLIVAIVAANQPPHLVEGASPPAASGDAPTTSADASGSNTLTMAKFSALRTGMSYAEAVAILGAPGTEVSSNEIAGTKTVMYEWSTDSFANMNAMFQDDKLMSKTQLGLK